jgi:hypothetical protein
MSRPRRPHRPHRESIPTDIVSEDGTQKAVLLQHQGIIIADYYRLVGAVSRSISWKWDRRAEVRMQPVEAALSTIQRIVNVPYVKRR